MFNGSGTSFSKLHVNYTLVKNSRLTLFQHKINKLKISTKSRFAPCKTISDTCEMHQYKTILPLRGIIRHVICLWSCPELTDENILLQKNLASTAYKCVKMTSL